ncbi:uncharacterized protein LY89DRAFT_730711 [Mollisia scopiformis]|uniref:DUF8035 domain-containing protein n=1 Tax=Mollisia scopiformis TaxID=149040 RepID=A0A194XKK8_MOLSC|nr:uncharacterized protein LY89DRAFT_730711 [Mollisia scopiformis]KUJ20693.1 hypothetical protein LY89DRAFT_730711 [Mollisia scopiformis]
MSRDYGYGRGRGGERWDSERFAVERDRARFEERDSRFTRTEDFGRARERSVDEIYERRGPRGFEEDRYERRDYYEDDRDYNRFGRDRNLSVTIEKERERDVYEAEPPRRSNRPAFLRRQSSLDTFDRKPLTRFVEREEYGLPARYRPEVRPPPLTPIPLPRTRALPPPRRFAERENYDEIEIAEPDFYGDERFRGYPERVREREIIRKKKRSRSRESRASHSVRGSVRSSSVSSSSSGGETTTTAVSVRSEFPKKGKTRMPARLVSKRAIIDLGYPFEEEGETIIIMKALGRENIDEVIKLSEDYKASETLSEPSTNLTTYSYNSEVEMHGGRSEAGTVIEERHEVFTIPPPPAAHHAPPAPPVQIVEDTKIIEHRAPSPHHAHHAGPIIMDARPHEESTFVERREVYERSDPMPVGPLVLAAPDRRKDERAIRAEIKALEAEKEALRAEKRAEKEMRKADRIRREGRASEGDLVLYERDRFETANEEITLVRRERIEEPEGGVRIEKDKKGRMAISVPKYYR